ncbi:MAG: hypothetical protein O2840_04195 [bacterium]|nr:hypothetical protein [bacterium]
MGFSETTTVVGHDGKLIVAEEMPELPVDPRHQAQEAKRIQPETDADKQRREKFVARHFEVWRTGLTSNVPEPMARLLFETQQEYRPYFILVNTQWPHDLVSIIQRGFLPPSESLPFKSYTYSELEPATIEPMNLERAQAVIGDGFAYAGRYVFAAAFVRLFLSSEQKDWELAISEWKRLESEMQVMHLASQPYREIKQFLAGQPFGATTSNDGRGPHPENLKEDWLPGDGSSLEDQEHAVLEQLIGFLQNPNIGPEDAPPYETSNTSMNMRQRVIWQLTNLAILRSKQKGWSSKKEGKLPNTHELLSAVADGPDTLRALVQGTPLERLLFSPDGAWGIGSDDTGELMSLMRETANTYDVVPDVTMLQHPRLEGIEAVIARNRQKCAGEELRHRARNHWDRSSWEERVHSPLVGLDIIAYRRWEHEQGLTEESGFLGKYYRNLVQTLQRNGIGRYAMSSGANALLSNWQLLLGDMETIVFNRPISEAEPFDPTVQPIFLDYFDSFMLLAETLTYHFKLVEAQDYNPEDRQAFDLRSGGLAGARHVLGAMLQMCVKMPAWQRELYSGEITKAIKQVTNIIDNPDVINLYDGPFPISPDLTEHSVLSLPQEEVQAYIWRELLLPENNADPAQLLRHDQELFPLQVRATAVPPGMEDKLFLGADGILYPYSFSKEEKEPKLPAVAKPETEKALAFEMPSTAISAEERGVSPELQAMTTEIMQRPERITLQTMGEAFAALEAALGAPFATELGVFIEQLASVRLALFAEVKNTADLTAALTAAQEFSEPARLSEKDISGIFTLFMAVFGEVPKQFVVELLFQIVETAAQAYVFRLIDSLHKATEKKLTFLRSKEALQSPILVAREKIRHLVQGSDPEQLTDSQVVEIVAELDKVLKYLAQHRAYDASVSDPLSSLFALNDEGVLSGRCNSQAMVLEAVLGFVFGSAAQVTNVSLFGYPDDLTVEQWLSELRTNGEHGATSHGQVGLDISKTTLTADLTWNQLSLVQTQLDVKRSIALDRSEARFMQPQELPVSNWWQRLKDAFYSRVTQSAAIASRGIWQGAKNEEHVPYSAFATGLIALYPDLRPFADQLSPDDMRVSMKVLFDKDRSPKEKLLALDKILTVDPFIFGFDVSMDFSLGQLIERMRLVHRECMTLGRPEVALFLSHILINHLRVDEPVRAEGHKLREQTLQKIGRLSREDMEACITRTNALPTAILSAAEQQQIRVTWQLVQAEIAELTEERQAEVDLQLEAVCTQSDQTLEELAFVQNEEDSEIRKGAGLLGDKIAAPIQTRREEVALAVVAENQAIAADTDDNRYMRISSSQQAEALAGILEKSTDPARQLALLQLWGDQARLQFGDEQHQERALQTFADAAQALGHQLPLTREEIADPRLLARRCRMLGISTNQPLQLQLLS